MGKCELSHDYFVNRKGKNLFRNKWIALEQRPKAGVFYVHGFGDHSSSMGTFAERLVSEGYVFYAHDHAGHGQSDGDRLTSDFDEYVNDIIDDWTEIKKQYPPEMPWFLIGHSMGGTASISVGLAEPDGFRGIVLVAPFLNNDTLVQPWKLALGRAFSYVWPKFGVFTLDPKSTSSDPAQVELYKSDPHVYHGRIPLIGVLNLVNGATLVVNKTPDFKVPFLIQHSPPDKLCPITGTEEFFATAGSECKTKKIYEGLEHNLIHERKPDSDIVIQDIVDWLNQRS